MRNAECGFGTVDPNRDRVAAAPRGGRSKGACKPRRGREGAVATQKRSRVGRAGPDTGGVADAQSGKVRATCLGSVDTMKTRGVNALQWDGCDRGGGENGFKWVSNGFPGLGERVVYRKARCLAGGRKLLPGKELGEAGW